MYTGHQGLADMNVYVRYSTGDQVSEKVIEGHKLIVGRVLILYGLYRAARYNIKLFISA